LVKGAVVVQEWRRLTSLQADEQRRADLGGLVRVFAELAGREEVWARGLEGWDVERSKVVMEWEARGEARGRAEGRAETLAVLRAKLLRLLEARFPGALPAEVVTAVSAQADAAVLADWLIQAPTAATLDEVRAAFGLA
jgi:hypothetical protein